MKQLSKIAGINLIVLFTYTILIHVANNDGSSNASLGILMVTAMPILLQVLANIVTSIYFFISKDNAMGRAFLLSALIVLIIGFSSCFGSASLAEIKR